MAESVKDRIMTAGFSTKQELALFAVLDAMRQDVAATRTAVTSTLAKLDADGGVTDANYASTAAVPALQTSA